MATAGLAGLFGHLPATAWRAAIVKILDGPEMNIIESESLTSKPPGSPLLCQSLRKRSLSQEGKSGPVKQSVKKPKLPVGRFDAPEDSHLEKEPLKKFPDDVNPVTKEKGGPRGPEPTRYGDWERKGRCIDF